MTRFLALLREAVVSAVASPVASIVSVLMVAGMCATVLLTTGRTVGSEQEVLASIDSAGSRSIIVRAQPDSGLDSAVLDRIDGLEGIAWAGAFGQPTDARSTDVPDGTRVPVRLAWGDDLSRLGVPEKVAVPGASVWASPLALDQFGLIDRAGGVTTVEGADYAVVGEATVPDYLGLLEPVAIVPQAAVDIGPVAVLVVVAERPDLITPVAAAVGSVLAVEDPSTVTVTTSENIATLRALVEGQLGTFGRELVLVIFGVTGLLVVAILSALSAMRRKDFGRRRALGASRGLIVALLLLQMVFLATLGTVVGTGAATVALLALGDPLPTIEFALAISVLAVIVSIVAAIVPAVASSRREPIRELRVP